jgi:hypothetical protein
MWNSTPTSALNLHPAGYLDSVCFATSGTYQVGFGVTNGTNRNHALLWNGTAASALDLHPAWLTDSHAYGVDGSSQIGWGFGPATGDNSHALLWNGTAASAVDLTPTGFINTVAFGINNGRQVGHGRGPATGNLEHALLWTGTAASAIDLHPLLSGLGPTFEASRSFSIADNGAIVGEALSTQGLYYAVLWTPVPEPTSCTLVVCGFAAVYAFRSRHRHS